MGTNELPPHCLGHIGYSFSRGKDEEDTRRAALRLLLPQVWQEGLSCVEIVADVDNIPSQRVIEANGGVLIERFTKSEVYGGKPILRYRVRTTPT